MSKKEHSKDSPAATQDEFLTRRAAMKRIAAGLAGVGIVVVAGIICPAKKSPYSDIVKEQYGDSAPK
ncbi:MAG: hypothetical protein WBV23_12825 [Desulfobaccales bacterium]